MDLQSDFFILEGRQVEALTLGIGATGTIVALLRWGVIAGLGFALGAGLSLVSYSWLKRGVLAVGEVKDKDSPAKKISAWVLVRFWGRYVFVALFVYVILTGFQVPASALFAGLFASTAGILIAAVWHLIRSGVTS